MLKRIERQLFEFLRSRQPAPKPAAAPLRHGTYLADSALEETIRQLRFLLNSAPMIDAPTDLRRASCARTAFAYIHPKTFAKIDKTLHGHMSYRVVKGSSTKWIMTSLMPEDRVIYSPHAIPGLERIMGAGK